jgi:hypothetical protein
MEERMAIENGERKKNAPERTRAQLLVTWL